MTRNSIENWELRDTTGTVIAAGKFQFYRDYVTESERELFYGQRMVVQIGKWSYFEAGIPSQRFENMEKVNPELEIR